MITKEKWGELIKDFHEKGVPELVERSLVIPEKTPLRRAISIIGPRRAGKTYSIFQLIKGILKRNVTIDRIVYLNLERTDLEGCESKDLANMLETFYEIYPENRNREIWLFLDEIQNVNAWERFVRTAIDDEKINVFITGSSSKLLSKEIATSMRGRTLTYTILPFSFIDFLTTKHIRPSKYPSSSERSIIMKNLREYITDGGYPEVIFYKREMEKILQDITETTIYKDIIERYNVRNIKLLKLLIRSLITSAQREFSVHKFYNFARSIGMRVSKNSIYNYLEALCDVFFVFLLRKFSYSYKEVEQSVPKIYIIDNGILSINGINDYGRLIENIVFVELIRRNREIYYYKSLDGKEVDFVNVKKNKVVELIQVVFSLDDFVTKEREIKALLKASKELKCRNLTVITWEYEGEERVKGRRIKFIPLWKWLCSRA